MTSPETSESSKAIQGAWQRCSSSSVVVHSAVAADFVLNRTATVWRVERCAVPSMRVVRACQKIRACTADPCVVRCGRGSGHAAGQAYGSLPGVDGAIAPTVGGDGSASDRLWRHCAGGACDGDCGVDDSAGPA